MLQPDSLHKPLLSAWNTANEHKVNAPVKRVDVQRMLAILFVLSLLEPAGIFNTCTKSGKVSSKVLQAEKEGKEKNGVKKQWERRVEITENEKRKSDER